MVSHCVRLTKSHVPTVESNTTPSDSAHREMQRPAVSLLSIQQDRRSESADPFRYWYEKNGMGGAVIKHHNLDT